MSINKKRLIVPLYIIFLLLCFAYVKSVLKLDPIEIEEKEYTPPSEEVKPVDVYLRVESDTYTYNTSYKARMNNVDSVMDLLNHLRDYEGFTYEITSYTYGVEFDHVNGFIPVQCPVWQLVMKSPQSEGYIDITNEVHTLRLEDGAEYIFMPRCIKE